MQWECKLSSTQLPAALFFPFGSDSVNVTETTSYFMSSRNPSPAKMSFLVNYFDWLHVFKYLGPPPGVPFYPFLVGRVPLLK